MNLHFVVSSSTVHIGISSLGDEIWHRDDDFPESWPEKRIRAGPHRRHHRGSWIWPNKHQRTQQIDQHRTTENKTVNEKENFILNLFTMLTLMPWD
uniref:Uncharacterized protein n=1 Tax=Haemonchus placei TaxID=6290 RepID=A0A0N4X5Z9_HAEPC